MFTSQLDYLVGARWFQGKGLPVRELGWRTLPWYVASGDTWVRSELATLQVGDSIDTYHLLTGYLAPGTAEQDALICQAELPGRGLVDVVDAPRSPAAMAAFLSAATGTGCCGITWLEDAPNPAARTQVFSGEQSNTTVIIGDDVLFKIFRRLTPGHNLEATTLAALARSGITPRLIGALRAGDEYDLGIFCQRIANAGDGWEYCVSRCRAGAPIGEDMARLGQALRVLHASLADAFGTGTIDAGDVGRQMIARLDAACLQAPELVASIGPLRRILSLPDGPIPAQRVHGDFHLGQALISSAGWTIIDFEGEPLKSPDERLAFDSCWRDVAGLCRSLDYVRRSIPGCPDGWYQDARAGFLRGYANDSPGPLLKAYEVDKAIYELVYETRNRPTWASIPRGAIQAAIAD